MLNILKQTIKSLIVHCGHKRRIESGMSEQTKFVSVSDYSCNNYYNWLFCVWMVPSHSRIAHIWSCRGYTPLVREARYLYPKTEMCSEHVPCPPSALKSCEDSYLSWYFSLQECIKPVQVQKSERKVCSLLIDWHVCINTMLCTCVCVHNLA